jgi:Zn-dependent alcohol dehydrogenase
VSAVWGWPPFTEHASPARIVAADTKAGQLRAATANGATDTVDASGIEESVIFPALSLMADGKTMRGSVYGASDPVRDIPVLADRALHGRLDLEVLVTRRIGIEDVEPAFTNMASGRGARSLVCFVCFRTGDQNESQFPRLSPSAWRVAATTPASPAPPAHAAPRWRLRPATATTGRSCGVYR